MQDCQKGSIYSASHIWECCISTHHFGEHLCVSWFVSVDILLGLLYSPFTSTYEATFTLECALVECGILWYFWLPRRQHRANTTGTITINFRPIAPNMFLALE